MASENNLPITFNVPVKVTVDGEIIDFPRVSVYDIADECEKLKQAKITSTRKLIKEFPGTIQEQFALVRQVEDSDPIVNDLWADVATTKGSIRILTRQLKLSGKTDEQVKSILAKLSHETAIETALNLVGYETLTPEEKTKAKKTPKKSQKEIEEEAPGFAGQ